MQQNPMDGDPTGLADSSKATGQPTWNPHRIKRAALLALSRVFLTGSDFEARRLRARADAASKFPARATTLSWAPVPFDRNGGGMSTFVKFSAERSDSSEPCQDSTRMPWAERSA